MSTYSVADATNQLSELIDRALRGEGVVITRHGRPMVELKPVDEPARPVSAADLDWIATHRVGQTMRPCWGFPSPSADREGHKR